MMMTLLKDLKATYGVNVRLICCNDAGKNGAFEQLCKHEGMGKKCAK